MNNLEKMLSKTLVSGSGSGQASPSAAIGRDDIEQICVKLPAHLVEYVRDFQHYEAMKTGNLHFSLKDAIAEIIIAHQADNPVPKRPASVRAAERKNGRRK